MHDARRLLVERRGLTGLLVLGLLVWLAVTFAGAIGDATQAERTADQLRAEISDLERRVEAGRREIGFVQTRLFLDLQARAFGLGQPGERAFALADGTPTPAPLALLGGTPEVRPGEGPLAEWLELLFGP